MIDNWLLTKEGCLWMVEKHYCLHGVELLRSTFFESTQKLRSMLTKNVKGFKVDIEDCTLC